MRSMTTLNRPEADSGAVSLPHFSTFGRFLSGGGAERPLRRALYRSDGPGFVIVSGFLEPEYVEHVRRFWLEAPPSP